MITTRNAALTAMALLPLLGACATSPPQPTEEVPHWGRFETTVPTSAEYGDPYRDGELLVTYTKPSGEPKDFWGFYDGERGWKIRFMPDELGTWTYAARFADGSGEKTGSFEVVPSDIPGMVTADETNPLWFGYAGGNHGLLRSFHVGDRFFASNWDDPLDPNDGEKRDRFLDWAQEQGYNMFAIASHYLNRDMETRGRGWETPDLLPYDADEWREMEVVLDELAERKIVVYPFAGFFGMGSDFPTDRAEQERYIKYTLARVGPYWNTILNVSGPHAERNLEDPDIKRLGQLIADLDPFDHMLAVHLKTLHRWPDSVHIYSKEPWSNYVLLQGPKPDHPTMQARLENMSHLLEKNRMPGQPTYLQEAIWPGNRCCQPDYILDPEQLRRLAWTAMMSATTLNYADLETNSSSGFTGSLEPADAVPWRHEMIRNIWDYFETIPFWEMSPRRDLVTEGFGFALANPGSQYLVYLPTGGSVEVKLDRGPYNVEWIRGSDTSDRRQGGQTTTGRLTAPTEGDDWAVRLTR